MGTRLVRDGSRRRVAHLATTVTQLAMTGRPGQRWVLPERQWIRSLRRRVDLGDNGYYPGDDEYESEKFARR